MNRSFEAVPLSVTPLTPVHVGCGEDYEPTHYVIDGEWLYPFDPTRLPLTTESRNELRRAAGQPADAALLAVQRFFDGMRDDCIGASRYAVSVAPGVSQWHASRIGQGQRTDPRARTTLNQLEIERTAHHPHSGEPYLPGSSLKGALRTAWLNRIDPLGRPADPTLRDRPGSAQLERELLGGHFASDPFRLVSLADASGEDVQARIVFAVDRDKRERIDPATGQPREKNLNVRREVLAPAQLRALRTEVRFASVPTLHAPPDAPAKDRRIDGFAELARAATTFYRARFDEEAAVLRQRRFVDDAWLDGIEALLGGLASAFAAGDAMLVRVGRHCGAESVTLSMRRSIAIRRGPGRPPEYARSATTLWLAADRADARSAMQPFGWIVVERADRIAAGDPVARWCTSQPLPDRSQARGRIAARRAEIDGRRAALLSERAEQQAREAAARAAQEADARRRATLSDEGREIDALQAAFAAYTAARPQPVGGDLYRKTRALAERALASPWSAADRATLAGLIERVAYKRIELGGKRKELAALVARLRSIE
jgi:CRISPR-associated protein Csm5